MSDERGKWNWWHCCLGAFCFLPAVFYITGYFTLVRPSHSGAASNVRIYPSRAIARAYVPLAWIEAHVNHYQVHLKTPDADHWAIIYTDGDWIIVDP
jgi:hypothetical protein